MLDEWQLDMLSLPNPLRGLSEAGENGGRPQSLVLPDNAALSVGSCCPLRMLPWRGSHPLLGQPSLVGQMDPTTQRSHGSYCVRPTSGLLWETHFGIQIWYPYISG